MKIKIIFGLIVLIVLFFFLFKGNRAYESNDFKPLKNQFGFKMNPKHCIWAENEKGNSGLFDFLGPSDFEYIILINASKEEILSFKKEVSNQLSKNNHLKKFYISEWYPNPIKDKLIEFKSEDFRNVEAYNISYNGYAGDIFFIDENSFILNLHTF